MPEQTDLFNADKTYNPVKFIAMAMVMGLIAGTAIGLPYWCCNYGLAGLIVWLIGGIATFIVNLCVLSSQTLRSKPRTTQRHMFSAYAISWGVGAVFSIPFALSGYGIAALIVWGIAVAISYIIAFCMIFQPTGIFD